MYAVKCMLHSVNVFALLSANVHAGANFINTQPANDLTDVVGHGTHVAGK